jgi:hypothetical protein
MDTGVSRPDATSESALNDLILLRQIPVKSNMVSGERRDISDKSSTSLLLDAPTILDGRFSTGEGLRSEPEDATANSQERTLLINRWDFVCQSTGLLK